MTSTDSAARTSRLQQIDAAVSSKFAAIGWSTAFIAALVLAFILR